MAAHGARGKGEEEVPRGGVQVRDARLGAGGHVEYLVVVLGQSQTAAALLEKGGVAWRRFSAFEKLLKQLAKQGVETGDLWPLLPSKMFGTSAKQRLPKLDRLLRAAVEQALINGEWSSAPEVLLDFLNLPRELADDGAGDGDLDNSVPDEFAGRIEPMLAEVTTLGQLARDGKLEAQGWKPLGSQGIVRWMSHAESGRRAVFARIPQSTARMIFEIANNETKKLEVNIASIRKIARKQGVQVQHFVMKSIMWLPPRDCIMVGHARVLNEEPGHVTIVQAAMSIDEYAGVPAKDTKGRVRATQNFGGVFIEELSEAETFVLWTNDMDPRVSGIPESYRPQVNDFSASMLANNLIAMVDLVRGKNLADFEADRVPKLGTPAATAGGVASAGADEADDQDSEDDEADASAISSPKALLFFSAALAASSVLAFNMMSS